MKKILNTISAFVAHVFDFVSNPIAYNFNTEKENYSKILSHSGLSNFDNYEDLDENFDDLESDFDEAFESFSDRGYDHAEASKKASTRMAGKHGSRWSKYVKNKSTKSLVGGKSLRGTNAQFSLQIFRLNYGSALVNTSLPIALFGTMHKSDGYSIMKPKIPAGVTLASAYYDQTAGSFVFNYTSNTTPSQGCYIIVTCQQISYTSLLDSLYTDSFRSAFVRYQVDTADAPVQFQTDWSVLQKTNYGKADENQVPVSNNRDPKNYQLGIIDIPNPIDIDKQRALVLFVKGTLTAPITLSFNVAKFYRQGAK